LCGDERKVFLRPVIVFIEDMRCLELRVLLARAFHCQCPGWQRVIVTCAEIWGFLGWRLIHARLRQRECIGVLAGAGCQSAAKRTAFLYLRVSIDVL
jgi:hypothetical protein